MNNNITILALAFNLTAQLGQEIAASLDPDYKVNLIQTGGDRSRWAHLLLEL